MKKFLGHLVRRLQIFVLSPRSIVSTFSGYGFNLFVRLVNMIFHGHRHACNICGWHGFSLLAMVGADYVRFNVICPVCSSSERSRAFIRYFDQLPPPSLDKPKCLDIAPVSSYRQYLEGLGWDYLSIDLYRAAMVKMDATHLDLPDDTYSLIICFHVLEHIKDDVKAVSEMSRVLTGDGTCYIMVPQDRTQANTVEYKNSNPLDPDHVRAYGRDFKDRFVLPGIKITEVDLLRGIEGDVIRHYRLGKEQPCFLLQKTGRL
jgi:SAM-dependent methyltransferase